MGSPALDVTSGGGRSILLVEDEADIRTSMEAALDWEGYRVVGASNGREALDRLRDMPAPSLILLDLMMPVMSGWELADALQADARLAAIPVVVLTAFADEAERKGIRAREVIRKPVDLDLLLRVVERHCG